MKRKTKGTEPAEVQSKVESSTKVAAKTTRVSDKARSAKNLLRKEQDNDDDDDDEAEDDEEEDKVGEKQKKTGAAEKNLKKGLVVKPSLAFTALNDKLMSAGRVSSVRLNLKPSTSSSSSGSSNNNKDRRNAVEEAQANSDIYNSSKIAAPPLQPPMDTKKKTLGKGWFDLEPAVLDESLKRDIKMIQMRNYIDPKRFYKNPDKAKAVLHVGTVIEGVGEYKSARLTNKERRTTILGEILADKQIKQYTKRKYLEIQESKPQRSRKRKGNGGGERKQKKVRKLF